MSKFIYISLGFLVENEFGVLTRITAMLRRYGVNIKTLIVNNTKNLEVSHMIITIECIESILPKIIDRIKRLNCVKKIIRLPENLELSKDIENIFKKTPEIEVD